MKRKIHIPDKNPLFEITYFQKQDSVYSTVRLQSLKTEAYIDYNALFVTLNSDHQNHLFQYWEYTNTSLQLKQDNTLPSVETLDIEGNTYMIPMQPAKGLHQLLQPIAIQKDNQTLAIPPNCILEIARMLYLIIANALHDAV